MIDVKTNGEDRRPHARWPRAVDRVALVQLAVAMAVLGLALYFALKAYTL
jgi:hypothetical protein